MKILPLLGLALVAGLFHTTPSQAQGRWCLHVEDRTDCSQPNFEVCHFATLGDGGGCFPAAGVRWRPEPRPQEFAQYAVNPWYYPPPIPTGTWCLHVEDRTDCSQPNFDVCHFSTLGDGGGCFPHMYYGVRYAAHYAAHYATRARAHHGTAFAQVRHRAEPAERTVAVARAAVEQGAVASPDQVACAEVVTAGTDAAPGSIGCPALSEMAHAEAILPAKPAVMRSAALVIPRGMPSLNVQPSCRAFAAVMGGSAQQELDHCLASENEARAQIVQQWSEFASADRSGCSVMTTAGGTYTEFLSCLEMRQQARNLAKDNPSVKLAVR